MGAFCGLILMDACHFSSPNPGADDANPVRNPLYRIVMPMVFPG